MSEASEESEASVAVRWDPPGPGQWALDRSHFPDGMTPIAQSVMESSMERGLGRVFAEGGTPATALRARCVNGFMYTRLLPLLRPERAGTKLPPTPVLKLVTRLHPAFRRRAQAATASLRDRPWLDVVRQWDHELKPQLRSQNRTFQAVDPSSLDDGALADHVARLFAHVERGAELHFWLHGHDLGPIALYLYSCVGWGIDPADAVVALAGASPSTTAPLEQLVAIRAELDSAGSPPSSITEVRAISAAAARLLDDYLAEYGDRLAAGYDVDTPTLRELPGALLTSIVEARPPDVVDVAATVAALRERVPGADRARFDVELGDARAVMNLRDDNGPITFEWPMGLLRRALLDAGRRLADDGRLADSAHVFELTVDEVVTLLERADSSVGGDDGDAVIGFRPPSRDVISARAARRHELRALDPPATLGPAEPTPPLDALPDPLPRLIEMVQFTIEQLDMAGATATDALSGTGIGTDTYRGRVCRAATADEAMDRMAPGDVLVVRATSPAFNMVLSIAGAVVTASGGPLSHAAVLARELGIPAVVGAAGAVDLPDGAFVEVDPVAGRVSVV